MDGLAAASDEGGFSLPPSLSLSLSLGRLACVVLRPRLLVISQRYLEPTATSKSNLELGSQGYFGFVEERGRVGYLGMNQAGGLSTRSQLYWFRIYATTQMEST